jgi:hypothetical protein
MPIDDMWCFEKKLDGPSHGRARRRAETLKRSNAGKALLYSLLAFFHGPNCDSTLSAFMAFDERA